MKKIKYLFTSFAVLGMIACGGGESHDHEGGNAELYGTEEHEDHSGHDHAAMQDAANTQELFDAPENARVFFANLEDGQTVKSPLKVEMGSENITIHPAGELIEGTGHHHIIIDELGLPFGMVVPADEHHIHFGGGQTEAEIELTPGQHQLTLQMADGLHRSYGERMAATITVNVEASK